MSITYHLFLDQFGETEWLAPAELQLYQERRLARLARHADASVEAYRDRLDGVVLANEQIDWNRWRDMPTLSQSDLAESGHLLLSADTPENHGDLNFRLNNDSAEAIGVAWTEYNTITEECLRIRLCAWHDVTPTKPLAILQKLPPEASDADRFWSAGFEAMDIPGPRKFFDTDAPDEDFLKALIDFRPAAIEGGPADIERLCQLIRSTGAPLRPETVLVTGSPMPEGLPRKCRRALGVSPIAAFSVPEIGTLAILCPQSGAYHTMSDTALIEILDENDQPVPVGRAGRVVATPFFNYAMPLLRYDTGDVAVLGGPCSCGRCLPTLTRIVGRDEIVADDENERA